MSDLVLDIRDLRFAYRSDGGARPVEVLRGLDLSVRRGDFIAIQGPSGSGKSTLFYILGCMLRPTGGSARFEGTEIASLSDRDLAYIRNARVGFVFQQFHLLPRASVLENILLPTRYPCEIADRDTEAMRARAAELARRLGLESHLERRPNQLSGGQQQRVAIARALMNDPSLILADEPTGNLDSQNAAQTMQLLRELNAEGKTIILITHDSEVARQCKTIYRLRDGKGVGLEALEKTSDAASSPPPLKPRWPLNPITKIAPAVLPIALGNLLRNRAKSALTMLGVIIGVAAVMAMITLGRYTKRKILETYEALGVNLVSISGQPNWDRKATDRVSVNFRAFDWEKDILPLRRTFPQIALMSPLLHGWRQMTATAGGRSFDEKVQAVGVNEQALAISNRSLYLGKGFTPYQIENQSPVCLIGIEIAEHLFERVNPIGEILSVSGQDRGSYPCKIIGVLSHQTSNKDWWNPDSQIWVPWTYFKIASDDWWSAQIHDVTLQLRNGSDVDRVGNGIKAFFERKYGKAGRFRVDSDMVLIAQMKRFLGIFAMLLGAIAFLSLIVGGIGINNMMLVSVGERLKEFGLRKALGATHETIRVQVLAESVVLCSLAGALGALAGFLAYEALIFAATRFVPNLKFEWLFDPFAITLSLGSILAVGIASGLVPAVKAEKLEVIEALRTE